MKKALVLVLCFALLLTLAVGCTPQTTTAGPTTTTSAGETTPATTTTMGPPAEIVYVYPLFVEQQDQAKIEAALNEITLAKLNVKVTLLGTAIANYAGQVPLKITGGEAMDLVCTMPGGPTLYSTMVAQGQLKDITDLAPMYAQAAIDAFNDVNPNYINGAYIGGKLYGLPNLFDKVSTTFLDMKKSVLDDAGLDLTKIKNITDLEAIVKTISEQSDIPVMGSSGNAYGNVLASTARLTNYDDFATPLFAEFFSSGEWAYGAIIGDDNTKVVNAYESDSFKQQITIAHDWFLKGYISKDAATQTDSGMIVMKANGCLAQITDGEIGHQTLCR